MDNNVGDRQGVDSIKKLLSELLKPNPIYLGNDWRIIITNNKMTEEKKLPEGEEDLAERITGLNKELQVLLGKFELGLSAEAGISPDGRIVARPIVVSNRKKVAQEQAPKLENPDN